MPENSRLMDTGGIKKRSREIVQEDLTSDLTRLFSIPESMVGNMYGMTELSSQFYDRAIRSHVQKEGNKSNDFLRAKAAPPWVRTRLVNPDTMQDVELGESGIIVHYDLANLYSVIAMMTEDVGIQLENGFILKGRAEGAEARGCSLAVEEFIRSTEGS